MYQWRKSKYNPTKEEEENILRQEPETKLDERPNCIKCLFLRHELIPQIKTADDKSEPDKSLQENTDDN